MLLPSTVNGIDGGNDVAAKIKCKIAEGINKIAKNLLTKVSVSLADLVSHNNSKIGKYRSIKVTKLSKRVIWLANNEAIKNAIMAKTSELHNVK